MIIKNHKEVYKNVAERLELPYDIIELIGNFTFTELANSLDNFEHRQTYVHRLGTFRFRRKRSLEYLEKVKNIKEKMIKMGRPIEQAEVAEERLKEKIAKMNGLIESWTDWYNEREEFRERKKQYYANRDIQEQSGNLGGSKESDV
jgi:hypothetical protein